MQGTTVTVEVPGGTEPTVPGTGGGVPPVAGTLPPPAAAPQPSAPGSPGTVQPDPVAPQLGALPLTGSDLSVVLLAAVLLLAMGAACVRAASAVRRDPTTVSSKGTP